MKINTTIAIIVSYFPHEDVFHRLVSAVALQVAHVVIVDNGSPANIQKFTANMAIENVHWLLLGHNFGVAKAQNAGIEWARIHDATHVLLLDQDSVPAPDMVPGLMTVHQNLEAQGQRVAAVGPRFMDSESGVLSSFVRFGWLGMNQIDCMHDSAHVEVDVLIASGSLISIATLDDIGGMDESLFIDYVDTDWILRAKKKGYSAFGACNAFMTHSLGENRRRLWFLRWRQVPIHQPFRFYYIFRNSLLLMRRDTANLAWLRCELMNLARLALLFVFFVAPRHEYFRMFILGVLHGLRGKVGSIDDALNAGVSR